MAIRVSVDVIPTGFASKSQGAISDQNVTYNEPGFIYNEPDITYGGFYGYSDIVPIHSVAFDRPPTNSSIEDVYTPYIPPQGDSGMLIGILGLTYP